MYIDYLRDLVAIRKLEVLGYSFLNTVRAFSCLNERQLSREVYVANATYRHAHTCTCM